VEKEAGQIRKAGAGNPAMPDVHLSGWNPNRKERIEPGGREAGGGDTDGEIFQQGFRPRTGDHMHGPFLCFNRAGLESILPHRGSALSKIDGVYWGPQGSGIIAALKEVKENDPDLSGHFPGAPTYPGYAQDEFVCIAAAALISLEHSALQKDPHVVQKIVRYRRAVAPGDTLIAEVRLRETRSRFYIFTAEIRNQRNEMVAEYEKIVGAV
jgi:3-hydroxymyristoyl/3-hydroxydecanoyl-(acyl carrier protein) dehydratase